MSNFIFPKEMAKDKAELILRSSGLQLIQAKFFNWDKENIRIEQQENELAKQDFPNGRFGLPVFDIIEFPAHSYTRNDGQVINNARVFLDVALIEVNQSRNIVTTQIQGRNGTVKEYISDNDYDVTIRGVLVSPHSNVPPTKLAQDVYNLSLSPIALDVYSNFLNLFNIFSIVIKDVQFNQIEGTRNAVGFSLVCISDTPFEIQYNEEQTIVRRSGAFF